MIERLLSQTVSWGLCANLTVVLTLAATADPRASTQGERQTTERDVDRLRHAAERGEADAQYALADAFANFLVESMEDAEAEAVRWYRLAADQGHGKAQLELGRRHEQGWGVPTDDAEAARWYHLAANQGLRDAQLDLGMMYAEGRGVTRDPVQAHLWLTLAMAGSPGEGEEKHAAARDQIAEAMLPAQLAEAERLAREWTPTTP